MSHMNLSMPVGAEELAILIFAMSWIWAWKGVALWKAARLSHRWWFIIFIALNLYTLGILEIIYIFFVANKYKVEATEVEETSALEPRSEEMEK